LGHDFLDGLGLVGYHVVGIFGRCMFGCFHERERTLCLEKIKFYLDRVLHTFSDGFSISNIQTDVTLSRMRFSFDLSGNVRPGSPFIQVMDDE